MTGVAARVGPRGLYCRDSCVVYRYLVIYRTAKAISFLASDLPKSYWRLYCCRRNKRCTRQMKCEGRIARLGRKIREDLCEFFSSASSYYRGLLGFEGGVVGLHVPLLLPEHGCHVPVRSL